MGLEVIRQDLVTALETAKGYYLLDFPEAPPLVMAYDNRVVIDPAFQVDPWIDVRIKIIDSFQRDIGSLFPATRYIGHLELAVAVKDGAGQSEANVLLDYFRPRLQRGAFGTVRTYTAQAGGPAKPHLDWQYTSMLVPFWSDQID